ncbi:MAG: hypothetical protein IPJ65_21620 [Archangiaceae bacterium]|nr:hypothetical protein [Archangiaceae bacterium]
MLALFLSSLLAATPVKLVAPPLSGPGLSADKVRVFTAALAQSLRASGIEVVTSDEIAVLLGAERQRQLLGCSESESCLAELGNALGTSATLKGNVARLDAVYQVQLTVLGNDTRIIAETSARASDEPALLDPLDEAARALARQLGAKLPRRLKPVAWVPGLLGLLSGAAGTVMLAQSKSDYDTLTHSSFSAGDAERVANRGSALQTGGFVALGVGTALLVAGVLLFLLGPQ